MNSLVLLVRWESKFKSFLISKIRFNSLVLLVNSRPWYSCGCRISCQRCGVTCSLFPRKCGWMPCLNFQHKMSKQAFSLLHNRPSITRLDKGMKRKETFLIGIQTSSSSQLQLFCFNVSDNITYAFIFFLGCSSVHLRYIWSKFCGYRSFFSFSFLISNYLINLLLTCYGMFSLSRSCFNNIYNNEQL